MARLSLYACSSVMAAVGVCWHAWHAKQQFYPAAVHLSTSKIGKVVFGNCALSMAICLARGLQMAFFGPLRDVEVERIAERSRDALMETCLALTIFRSDFDATTLVLFAALFFGKVFHWLAQDREAHLETSPEIRVGVHVKLLSFLAILMVRRKRSVPGRLDANDTRRKTRMLTETDGTNPCEILQVVDVVFLYHALWTTWTTGPSVLLLFAFEYTILCSTVVMIVCKYGVFMADMYTEGTWTGKGTTIFYLELAMDFFHMVVYLSFFSVVLANYGLPLHLMRDLYWTFRNFKNRLVLFLQYRKIASNINTLFPNATEEDLERADRTCAVCREEMHEAKKLPCGHCYHVHCLRSWLERQQNCPICRSPVPTEAPTTRPAADAEQQDHPDMAEGFGDAQEFLHQPLGGPVEEELRHRRRGRAAVGEGLPHFEGQDGFEGEGVSPREQAMRNEGDGEPSPQVQSLRDTRGGQVENTDGPDGFVGTGWRRFPGPSSVGRTGYAGATERAPGLGLAIGGAGTNRSPDPTPEQQQIALAAAVAATKAACRRFPSADPRSGSFAMQGLSSKSKALTREVLEAQRMYLRKQMDLLDALESDMSDVPPPRG